MRFFALVSVIAFALAVVSGCTQVAPSQQVPASPTPVQAGSPASVHSTPVPLFTPISQAPVSANTITIKNFAFDPQTMTVNAGSTVRWENHDNAPHRVVFIDSAGRDTDVDSGVLSSRQSWSNKFDKPGTYDYYCTIHPEMKGKIIVM